MIHCSRTPQGTTKTTLVFEAWSSNTDPKYTTLALRGAGTDMEEDKGGFETKLLLRLPAHLPVAQLCRTTKVDTVVIMASGDVALGTL